LGLFGHVEISKEYFDDLKVGDKVVVLDKESYDSLKKSQK